MRPASLKPHVAGSPFCILLLAALLAVWVWASPLSGSSTVTVPVAAVPLSSVTLPLVLPKMTALSSVP